MRDVQYPIYRSWNHLDSSLVDIFQGWKIFIYIYMCHIYYFPVLKGSNHQWKLFIHLQDSNLLVCWQSVRETDRPRYMLHLQHSLLRTFSLNECVAPFGNKWRGERNGKAHGGWLLVFYLCCNGFPHFNVSLDRQFWDPWLDITLFWKGWNLWLDMFDDPFGAQDGLNQLPLPYFWSHLRNVNSWLGLQTCLCNRNSSSNWKPPSAVVVRNSTCDEVLQVHVGLLQKCGSKDWHFEWFAGQIYAVSKDLQTTFMVF